jgi:anti-sigma regulatory factor (Ser/Thr protein kinase)
LTGDRIVGQTERLDLEMCMIGKTVTRHGKEGQEFRWRVLAAPMAVKLIRDLAEVHLRAWGLDAKVEDGRVVTSELLTNAYRATPGLPIEFGMYVLAGTLVLEVWDSSPGTPVRREARDEDLSGRGLGIVEALADAWGHRVSPDGGKTVWAEMACTPT